MNGQSGGSGGMGALPLVLAMLQQQGGQGGGMGALPMMMAMQKGGMMGPSPRGTNELSTTGGLNPERAPMGTGGGPMQSVSFWDKLKMMDQR